MREITPPADITVLDRSTGLPIVDSATGQPAEPFSFRRVAFWLWLNDSRASQSVVKLARWVKVVDAIDKSKPLVPFTLDDEAWTMLKEIVETTGTPLGALIGTQLLPHFNAVLDAKHVT